MANGWEKVETMIGFIFLGSKITGLCLKLQNYKMLAPWKKNYDKPRQHNKKQRHHCANEDSYS